MTDDSVIEEAAKAMLEESHGEGAWESREQMEEDLYLRRARAAFAVFEKAHAPTEVTIRAAIEADRMRIRSTIGAFLDEGVWGFDGAVSTLDRSDPRQRAEHLAASKAEVAMGNWQPYDPEPLALDPTPWVFISDQVFGVPRSDHDKGYHAVSGTYWALQPRPEFEQDRTRYDAERTANHEIRRQG